MRILLDGSQCDDLNATTIGEAIEGAYERARQLGRIVVQVDVNERTLDAEELGDPRVIGTVADEVALTSLEPAGVLLSSLELGMQALTAANEQFAEAARSIQAGEPDKATAPLQEGIELWRTVDEHVLREAVPMVLDTSANAPSKSEFEGLLAELQGALGSIKQTISSGDLAALSDSLLYEFPVTAERWVRFFEECTKALTRVEDDLMKGSP